MINSASRGGPTVHHGSFYKSTRAKYFPTAESWPCLCPNQLRSGPEPLSGRVPEGFQRVPGFHGAVHEVAMLGLGFGVPGLDWSSKGFRGVRAARSRLRVKAPEFWWLLGNHLGFVIFLLPHKTACEFPGLWVAATSPLSWSDFCNSLWANT